MNCIIDVSLADITALSNASVQPTSAGGSRFKDKQLFNPTYSASSLMKGLPDRMSSVSSQQSDIAEMASLDDDLDFDPFDSSESTPKGSMHGINTAHMLPALREQLESMGKKLRIVLKLIWFLPCVPTAK